MEPFVIVNTKSPNMNYVYSLTGNTGGRKGFSSVFFPVKKSLALRLNVVICLTLSCLDGMFQH